ncbi:peptidase domain-containing ABC transporter [Streptococcus henryi]|uniref:peptidase domain-containing ABC transporter n=1 Tax=Streptococcus henryi TaxID=439219 RepID=UPI0003753CBD|nr:peptidase domain-containing ABC transporter [Streptococcus henryi]
MKYKIIKLRPTMQISNTECGLCCVRTILEAFGYNTSLIELRQINEPGRDGLSIKQLGSILSNFGIDSKIYKIHDIIAFENLNYPLIAFWKDSHFICLESFSLKSNKVVIMDPSIGRLAISIEDFKNNFSNYILFPQKSERFESKSKEKFRLLKREYLWPKGIVHIYFKIFLVLLSIMLINLSVPLVTQALIDNLSFKNDRPILIIPFVILFLSFFTNYFKTYFASQLMYKFSLHLMTEGFKRILSIPAKYFSVRTPGEISYRFNSLLRIQDILGTSFVQFFIEFLSSLALLIYIYYCSIYLGITITLIISMVLYFLYKTQFKILNLSDQEIHSGSKYQSIQLDAIVSINSIKLGGYAEKYFDDWKNNFSEYLSIVKKRIVFQQGVVGATISSLQTSIPFLVLLVSLMLVSIGYLSLGQAIALQTVVSSLFYFTSSLFNIFSNFLVSSKYIELSEDIFEYPIEKNFESSLKVKDGAIVLNDINFKYTKDSSWALENINLEIKDGETIALVGKSGSGKSTLAKIICTLFEPTSGQIVFGGQNYDNYNLTTLRESISYIPQEAHLHNRKIIENIDYGQLSDKDKLIEKCRELGFLDFIDAMPMGYDTVVSEMGGNLSGGQRQRIHIARALLSAPKILVMDEATSSLDNITQAKVYDLLSQLKCTKIVIAHRLETVLNADKIVVLDKGRIMQVGEHHEMIQEKNGIYSHLFTSNLSNL